MINSPKKDLNLPLSHTLLEHLEDDKAEYLLVSKLKKKFGQSHINKNKEQNCMQKRISCARCSLFLSDRSERQMLHIIIMLSRS